LSAFETACWCDDAISRLKADRKDIEREFGAELEWNEYPGSARIAFSERGYNLLNRGNWAQHHSWLVSKIKAYQQVLLKRIDGKDVFIGTGL
jgi:hypothetical protein